MYAPGSRILSVSQQLSKMRISEEDKRNKVHGILSIIEPCSHVLEVTLPLQKDNGQFEMITGNYTLRLLFVSERRSTNNCTL